MAKVVESSEPTLAPGAVIDGRYRVVRPIGEGGTAVVHEVEHVLTGRRLALKSLLEDTGAARLEQEARAAALMKNPHAVKITDMGQDPKIGPYLVMDLLEGGSLRDLLEETGQLPVELTVDIALQVCECLAEAHAHGIVHRDLKPDNVHLCPAHGPLSYDVKVLDFGIVKVDDAAAIPKASLTRTGSTVGTPFYMSLEQLRSSSSVDARADVYSLCVVLYECLSGTKPFQAETIGDLVYVLCSGPPPDLQQIRPDVPAALSELITRGLSINREKRPPSMRQLALELLPWGRPAGGAWLKQDTGPRARTMQGLPSVAGRAAASPPRPGADRMSGSGPRPAAPALDAPAPDALAPAGAAVEELGRAATVPADGALAAPSPVADAIALPDLVLERRAAPAAPAAAAPLAGPGELEWEPAATGSRDTPTEMYQKGFELAVDLHAQTGRLAHPDDEPEAQTEELRAEMLRGLPEVNDAASALSRSGGYPVAAPPVAAPPVGAQAGYPAAPGSYPAALPMPAMTGTPPPVAMTPVSASQPAAQPTPPPPGATLPQPLPPGPPKPPWQESLDDWLADVGGRVDDWGRALLQAFREAPPRQQVALVVICAGLVGVFVLMLLYLSLRK